MVQSVKIDVELDARNLSCPMPLLKAKRALNGLPAGGVLQVLATDPGSVRDFQAWAKQGTHDLLSFSEERDTFIYVLKKNE